MRRSLHLQVNGCYGLGPRLKKAWAWAITQTGRVSGLEGIAGAVGLQRIPFPPGVPPGCQERLCQV